MSEISFVSTADNKKKVVVMKKRQKKATVSTKSLNEHLLKRETREKKLR